MYKEETYFKPKSEFLCLKSVLYFPKIHRDGPQMRQGHYPCQLDTFFLHVTLQNISKLLKVFLLITVVFYIEITEN